MKNGQEAIAEEESSILHVDMDAFFASIEQRNHPEYRGRPVVVGSPPDARGVVSTCSYEARKYGIHSAMPSRSAYRLCPNAIFVRPDMALYLSVSEQIFSIFERYTPLVQGLSCDEAFLDVSGARLLFGDAVTIAKRIRSDLSKELQLTASVGVAKNLFLAKLASDLRKPNGLTVVPNDPEEIRRFLEPLSVTRIFGVGKTQAEFLRTHGILTIGDLQRTPLTHLQHWFGEHTANGLHALAFGRDTRKVEILREEKSISRETTFLEDTTELSEIRATLLFLADDVARRVRAAKRYAGTAHLKWRTGDFKTRTRQIPFSRAASDTFSYREAALRLMDSLLHEERGLLKQEGCLRDPVRLIGFGVSHFCDTPPPAQQDLFASPASDAAVEKREALSHTLDRLRTQFGNSVHLGFSGKQSD